MIGTPPPMGPPQWSPVQSVAVAPGPAPTPRKLRRLPDEMPVLIYPKPAHRLERLVQACLEEIYRRVRLERQAIRIAGRPAFTVTLTPLEQYQRWADPVLRAQEQAKRSPQDYEKWNAEMMELGQEAWQQAGPF